MSGKWIVPKAYTDADRCKVSLMCFRKRVSVNCVPDSVLVKITADSRYKLYINKQLCEIGPEKGDLTKWYIDQVNIAGYLKEGENELFVKVLHYQEDLSMGGFSIFRTPTPGLYMDSEYEAFCTDESWCGAMVPDFHIVAENPFFAPLQIYEEVSGKVPEDHYVWQEARIYLEDELTESLRSDHLFLRDIPFMYREPGRFKTVTSDKEYPGNPILIPANQKYEIELNASELQCGYLKLAVKGGRNSRIQILQAESYVEYKPEPPKSYDDLPRKGDRSDYINGVLSGFTDTYMVGGYGTKASPEIYEPFFFRTFRYIKLTIETKDDAMELLDFAYEATGYPLSVVRIPENMDEMQNQIWEMSLRTLRRCMHETYMDCPFYERLQYVMDSRSQMIYTYAVSDDDRLARKCMDDMSRSQYPDGLLNACYPSTVRNVIPGFSIYFIGMLYDHMKKKGDAEFVGKYLTTVEKILAFFDTHRNEKGIVDKIGDLNKPGNNWSFIDWTPQWDATNGVPAATLKGPLTMESMLYLLGLQYMTELLQFTKNSEKALVCETKAKELAAAIKENCLGRNRMYKDGPDCEAYSQHTQVFAVLTGLTDPKTGKEVLLETLRKKEQYAQCSVAMLYYLFRALEMCGAYEETKGLWSQYEDMVRNHLTTCAEDSLKSRSDCHAWGALALYEYLHMGL